MTSNPDMNTITVHVVIQAPIQIVWECWTVPSHITKWCFASNDWHAPSAENDLRVGGKFVTTMAAKDESTSFDFGGTYIEVSVLERIAYTMNDGRKVQVDFEVQKDGVHVTEEFDPESQNPLEMQRTGWQAILNNFKVHTERVASSST
jgi:uncharacterized protein YndB with AHSA1/START domain